MKFGARKIKNQKGFTIMELLVVLALLGILLSISLFNYEKFGKEVELENSAYSLALAIREAQVYGINQKARDGEADPREFGSKYGYGVFFTKDTNPNHNTGKLTNDKFAFFIDNSGDKMMNGNCDVPANECYSTVSIEKGNYISEIKYISSTDNTKHSWGSVSIYFLRPNPDATFNNSNKVSRIQIKLTDSSEQYFSCVEVGVAGDITVKKTCWE